jgi:hypothetical protein
MATFSDVSQRMSFYLTPKGHENTNFLGPLRKQTEVRTSLKFEKQLQTLAGLTSEVHFLKKACVTGYSRGTCTPMFIIVLVTIAKLWKQPRCPTTD